MKQTQVLIESDWNLKVTGITFRQTSYEVLIESDWNLKGDRIKAYFLELKY